ncbi:MAG: SDR family oxidoreductase [Merismopedia sp. SIO2A8]|nr:SDR family oxidoreductase [Symploca sp. SIO2B6]NET50277.1 SDR family oxidoreductase [Merismopedia sp. SIO2A8]
MTQLSKAVVLLTGATGGFGQELAQQLLVLGSHLILTDLDQATLEQQVATLGQTRSPGKILTHFTADLSSSEGCDRLHSHVQQFCQSHDISIDVLINNAGIAVFGRMDEVPQDQWETLMQINLLSPMRLSALFAAEMIARQRGHIVNISSIAGWVSPPGLAHYSASKFGLRGFSEGLFSEVGPYNVQVTAVYPYFSRTPILRSPRYGTLAKSGTHFSESDATDPAAVMRQTIRAIQQNQLHTFPDWTAKMIQVMKRLFPKLSIWVLQVLTKRK